MLGPEENEESAGGDSAPQMEPANKPTLLLHIGPGKTGSSAIQAWLAAVAEDLIPQGILYPPSIKEVAQFSGNGQDLAALLHQPRSATGDGLAQALEDMLRHYASLAVEENCHTILLSSEFLSEAPQENLELLKQCAEVHFELRIIGFVRDPYWWLWSAWGQSVKRGGLYEDFSEYARRNLTHYGKALCGFVELFGDARLLVYKHDTLLDDFAGAAGIRRELLGVPQEIRINRSLDKDELDILLAVNRIFKNAALSTGISDRMLSRRPDAKPYKHFEPVLASEIRDANAPLFASVSHLIGNSDIPVIDEQDRMIEMPRAAPPDSAGANAELFHLVLTAIGAWHEEGSPLRQLRQLAMEPPPEAAFKDTLPEGFNSIEYLLINPDVLAAGANPVAHYLEYGRGEGRLFHRPEQIDD